MFDFLKSVIGKGKQAGMPPTEAEDVTHGDFDWHIKLSSCEVFISVRAAASRYPFCCCDVHSASL
jgi:hypothetical protein